MVKILTLKILVVLDLDLDLGTHAIDRTGKACGVIRHHVWSKLNKSL